MLRMGHGLGDNVQFQIVVRHLKHYRPDDELIVETKYPEVFRNLCRTVPLARAFAHTKWNYDQSHYVRFARPEAAYGGLPSTKATRCLIEEFDIKPIPEFYFYELHSDQADEAAADDFLLRHELDEPIVLLHYEGASSPERKNLSHDEAKLICDGVRRCGNIPVIIDFDVKSPLPDGKTIFRADVPRSATALAALIEQSVFFFGIDSGPLHIAAATTVPSVGIWKDYWPGHNIDPAPNQEHWICPASVACIEGNWYGGERDDDEEIIWTEDVELADEGYEDAVSYFCEHYLASPYRDLVAKLAAEFKEWGVTSDRLPK